MMSRCLVIVGDACDAVVTSPRQFRFIRERVIQQVARLVGRGFPAGSISTVTAGIDREGCAMASVQVKHIGGDDAPFAGQLIEVFRLCFRRQVIVAGEPDYDEARRVGNGMVDEHSAAIARCRGVAAVNFARTEKLVLAVRAGGHNVAGKALWRTGDRSVGDAQGPPHAFQGRAGQSMMSAATSMRPMPILP
jgi:hypothetical protein